MANTRSTPSASRSRVSSRSKSPSRRSTPSKAPKKTSSKVTTQASKGPLFPHGLYPTVAVTDTVNAAAHYYAAAVCFNADRSEAAWGFLTVAFAATIGVARFGFHEHLFAKTNGDLADFAAFVGLPLVGRSFMPSLAPFWSFYPYCAKLTSFEYIITLCFVEQITRALPKIKDDLKVLPNVLLFVVPVLLSSYQREEWECFIGMIIFVVSAVVIKPEREKYLFGCRRENLFHWGISIAAALVARGIP
ncbi:hypothetical protein TrVE_jg10199 [Triparma verrucosa]|uniref:Uncharacterized protein n=2 Tax=Triparma TaxID=722752 RepID=A0A9W6ZL20_9STRA|nr:hypothetical protein TrST_g11912 [Triparma strigata]GMH84947.1 hypothetical protein TrVE_jg10199 [Triparma verrucosa]